MLLSSSVNYLQVFYRFSSITYVIEEGKVGDNWQNRPKFAINHKFVEKYALINENELEIRKKALGSVGLMKKIHD